MNDFADHRDPRVRSDLLWANISEVSGVKRTSPERELMSANEPKWTSACRNLSSISKGVAVEKLACHLEILRSRSVIIPQLEFVEALMRIAGSVLPLALFGALFGFQSDASAGPLPPTTASMDFVVCGYGGICEAENPPINFPPNPNAQTVNGPTVDGTSVGFGSIGFQPPASSAQTPSSQITGYLDGYPSSTLNILFTTFFEFMPLSGMAPPIATAELSAIGGVQTNQPTDISGDVAYASVTISNLSSPATVYSACAILGSVSVGSCGAGSAPVTNPFSVSQSLSLTPGDIYSLQLAISLASDISDAPAQFQNLNASIDPTITNEDPSDFRLLVSATPLPSAWTMMLIGLAGLGFVAYRGTLGAWG
jgi:hypothetical protein